MLGTRALGLEYTMALVMGVLNVQYSQYIS